MLWRFQLHNALTSGLSSKDQAEFKQLFRTSKVVRDRINDLLTAKIQDNLNDLSKKDRLLSPNYHESIGYDLGYIKGLQDALTYLKE